MNLKEEKLNSVLKYDGKIFKAYRDEVELPDKTQSFREYVRHCGGAAVLLVLNNRVALVNQYRYVYGKEMYEIPAGKLEEGEDPAAGAARELEEETGYRADCVHLIDIYPSPGYTDEVIHIYLAENARFVGQRCDEGEFLNFQFIPLERVLEMIESGKICDAKTVAAVYKYVAQGK